MSRHVLLMAIFVCAAGVIAIQGAQNQGDKSSRGAANSDIDHDADALQLAESEGVDSDKSDREQAIQKLLDAWKAAHSETERRTIEQQLRDAIKSLFRAQSAKHDLEIKRLEEKLEALRDQLHQRHEKQDEIVELRLQQLLLDAQGLGWGSDMPEPSNESSATHRRQPTVTVEPSSASITPLHDPPTASIAPGADLVTPDTIRSAELAVEQAKAEFRAAQYISSRKHGKDQLESLNQVDLAQFAVRRAEQDLETAKHNLAWQLRSMERDLQQAEFALKVERTKDKMVQQNFMQGSVSNTEALEQKLAVERAQHRFEEASDTLSRLKGSPAASE